MHVRFQTVSTLGPAVQRIFSISSWHSKDEVLRSRRKESSTSSAEAVGNIASAECQILLACLFRKLASSPSSIRTHPACRRGPRLPSPHLLSLHTPCLPSCFSGICITWVPRVLFSRGLRGQLRPKSTVLASAHTSFKLDPLLILGQEVRPALRAGTNATCQHSVTLHG